MMREHKDNVYKRNGFASREDYLRDLAERFGVRFWVVVVIADMLGSNEDFDGLVSELQDVSDSGEYDV